MPETSLPVEHLFTFTGTVGRGMSIKSAPMGTRVVVPVLSGVFEGQKLRGRVAADAPSGDWVYSRADGSIKLDVRVTLLTDDGAVILMTYSGIGVLTLADQALAFAAMTVVPADRAFRTINLNVNFIRVGRAHPLAIEAVVVAQTRQMITVRATVKREDGELVAEASAQQVLQALAPS